MASPARWRPWAAALCGVLIAGSVTALLPPLREAPFAPFFAAVVLTAAYGGLGPALLATALSALVVGYFFFLTPGRGLVPDPDDLIRLGTFALLALLVAWFAAARRKAEAELRRRLRQQEEIAALGQQALTAGMQALMESAAARVAGALEVEYAGVAALAPGGGEVVLQAGAGWRPGAVGRAYPAGRGSLAGYALEAGRPVAVEDLGAETRFEIPPLLREHRVISSVAVLIGGRERPFGALTAHSTRRHRFGREDINFLESAAGILAAAAERDRALAAIRASESRLRAVLDATLDALITIDHQGRILAFNPAAERMFGWRAAEAVGAEMGPLIVPPPLRERYREGFLRALAAGQAPGDGQPTETSAVRRDGSEFPVEMAVVRIPVEGPPLFTAHLRDLTERKQRQEAERRADALRAVTQVASGAAHEINNPLLVIVGSLELMEHRFGEDEFARTRLGASLDAARRIKEIVARMGRLTSVELARDGPGLPERLDIRRSSADPGATPPGARRGP